MPSSAAVRKSSRFGELILAKQCVVEMGERDRRAAARTGPADFSRAAATLTREDDGLAVGGELHVIESGVAGNSDTRAAAGERG